MHLTSDALVSMLRASVADAYGDADALAIGEDPGSGEVVVSPPMTGPSAAVWAISVCPGLVPVHIDVLGDLPLEDSRFQSAIGDTLGTWVEQPELLDDLELAILDQLRIRDDRFEAEGVAA